MSSSKKVSFAQTSLVVFTPGIRQGQKSKLWMSRDEISSSKLRWAKTIHQVQNMNLDAADKTDASDYMGLERYLSQDIMKQSDEHRVNYIDSVVKAQHKFSCHNDLARFARRETRANVARSHSVGVFYANKHFQEFESNQIIRDFKIQSSKSTDAHDRKVDECYKFMGIKRPELTKSATARCA